MRLTIPFFIFPNISETKVLHKHYLRWIVKQNYRENWPIIDLGNTADKSTIFKLLGRALIISCQQEELYYYKVQIAVTLTFHDLSENAIFENEIYYRHELNSNLICRLRMIWQFVKRLTKVPELFHEASNKTRHLHWKNLHPWQKPDQANPGESHGVKKLRCNLTIIEKRD